MTYCDFVKDVITEGLQNLIKGNKNSLSDYNEAFQKPSGLQRNLCQWFPDQPERKLLHYYGGHSSKTASTEVGWSLAA
jgi:hypothetical protein